MNNHAVRTNQINQRQQLTHYGVLLFSMLVSILLMFHTFGYDSTSKTFLIAPKCWSDFGAHIPLIRSFSKGANLARLFSLNPVESPLFPGEPIRYHYGFYALVGIMEKLGMRIDWALNLPSAIGLFALLIGIYWVGKSIFGNTAVGILSIFFFLCNGSFSFLAFFQKHPISWNFLYDIVTNSKFSVFGPWDGQAISAFWTLNIYTNQRHLALSYAIVLFLIYFLFFFRVNLHSRLPEVLEKNIFSRPSIIQIIYATILIALSMSLLLFINHAAAGIAIVFIFYLFVLRNNVKIPIVLGALTTLPMYIIILHTSHLPSNIFFHPWYLIKSPVHVMSFLQYWIQNIGLHLLFIPLGMVLAPKNAKKLLIIPLLLLFIIPQIWQFSPDMINNHKFFNFFLIIGNMFSAYALVFLFQKSNTVISAIMKRINYFHKYPKLITHTINFSLLTTHYLLLTTCIFFLTLSGIIDLFPIINDPKGTLSDIGSNNAVAFIKEHTKPSDIVLNSTWFYHSALLSGRSVFSGYPYFTWSYGYDKDKREVRAKNIYQSQSMIELCKNLIQDKITLVEIADSPEYVEPNWDLWNSIPPSFRDEKLKISLFLFNDICIDNSITL